MTVFSVPDVMVPLLNPNDEFNKAIEKRIVNKSFELCFNLISITDPPFAPLLNSPSTLF